MVEPLSLLAMASTSENTNDKGLFYIGQRGVESTLSPIG